MTIVGLHDHAAPIKKLTEEPTSITWLTAMRKITNERKYYYLATNDREKRVVERNHENYFYLNKNYSAWAKEIIKLEPKVILFNVCYYDAWTQNIKWLREKLPETTFICRIHHDVRYLSHHPGFFEFIAEMDTVITPSETQLEVLASKIKGKKYYHQIFAANIDWVEGEKIKKYKLVSTANKHPARNLRLILRILKKLQPRLGLVRNLQGIERSEFLQILRQSEYFLLPSLTEASGSRVLIEAIKSGCVPIVFEECESAVELLQKHSVPFYSIKTNLKYHPKYKFVLPNLFAANRISREIFNIISRDVRTESVQINKVFDESEEVEKLKEIILDV